MSWKLTQVKQKLTWLTFVRFEEDNPFELVPSNISLHGYPLRGLSKHLLLLEHILVSKWGLRPNIRVRAVAPHRNIYREIEIRMLIKEHWQYHQSRLKLNHNSTNLLTFNFWLVYIQAFSNVVKFLIVWFYLNSGKLPNQIKEKMSIMILV